MTCANHSIECPICNGDGSIEVRLPASTVDSEPRYRVTPCDRCDGHGEIVVDGDTRRLLEAAGGNLEAELAATKRERDALREGVSTRSKRIVELEERVGKPCPTCVGYERTRDALEAKRSRAEALEAALDETTAALTAARAELAVERSKAPAAAIPDSIFFAGTCLRRSGSEWFGSRDGCEVFVSDLLGVRDAPAFEASIFNRSTGERVIVGASSLDLLEAKLAVSLFVSHPAIAARLLDVVEVQLDGSRAHG